LCWLQAPTREVTPVRFAKWREDTHTVITAAAPPNEDQSGSPPQQEENLSRGGAPVPLTTPCADSKKKTKTEHRRQPSRFGTTTGTRFAASLGARGKIEGQTPAAAATPR
jgi:hypothetical protein